MKRIFLLAGEPSGDLHGALLARALQEQRGDLELCGIGGQEMEKAGVRLIARSEDLAVVGLLEVLGQAGRFLKTLRMVRSFFRRQRPDLFVPIDYPDFNFRLLPEAKRLGIPIVYYISPQVWAWRPGRVKTLRRYIRRMLVIFPFEEAIYRAAGIPVTWVGHPLIDLWPAAASPIEERRRAGLDKGLTVAILPGSRWSEFKRIAPCLLGTRALLDRMRRERGAPPIRWILGRAPGLPTRADELWSRLDSPLLVRTGVEALRLSDLALVASGTVTLEACLLGRPVIVVYRMNRLTYALARRMVRVEHIAMANLLAGRRLVPEFLQGEAEPQRLAEATDKLLQSEPERERIRDGLLASRETLGPPGAAGRAAAAVLEILREA